MKNFLKATIEKLENNLKISFWQIVLLIYTASFLRGFFENFANFYNQDRMTGLIDVFFHYPFWFFGVFISAFILLKFLTREKIEKVSRVGAMFSWVIILAPILDLIIRKGNQIRYAFIVGNFPDLIQSFFSFFGGVIGGMPGATLGMKIEILLGILGVGYYVFHKTKKISRALASALIFYLVIFIFLSLPTFIFAAKNALSENPQPITYQTISDFYYRQDPANSFTKDRTFIFENSPYELTKAQTVNNHYSVSLSIIFLIIDVFLLGWWFWLYNAKKFIAVIKNFRFFRITHYFLMASFGIYLGIKFSGYHLNSLFDFLSFASLFLCLLFAWLFSVWENDEEDMEIDQLSNSDRPLVKGFLTSEEWRNLKYLFLFLALSFAFLGGFYLLTFALLFLISYHIYSAPPLRLKKFFGISSLLVALNALIAVWMGFFMAAGTENLRVFPAEYTLGILMIFFLAEHVKNLKDVEGDKKEGIQTLPVFFGLKNGKLITGIFAFFALLLVPIIFYLNIITFLTAAIFGMALFLAINAEKFKEKYAFIIYFIFAAVFMAETVILPLLI